MNWEALGAVAETAGAIGVITTLFYLARQLNQNTETVRASAIAATYHTSTDVSRLMAQDPVLAKVFWAGMADREALSEEDRYGFDSLMAISVHSMNHTLALSRR